MKQNISIYFNEKRIIKKNQIEKKLTLKKVEESQPQKKKRSGAYAKNKGKN